jgi:penicillin-binding protein 2
MTLRNVIRIKPVAHRIILLLSSIVLWLLVACSPAQQTEVIQVIPTLAALEQPPSLDMAVSVALNFLESWRLSDFPAMYNLVALPSREATPLETFISIYQDAQDQMTLERLAYAPGTSLYRDPNRSDVVNFNYSVTFTTRLVGEFTDDNRNMRLVYDSSAKDWRIAWTPGDIFAKLEGGGQLRLEVSIPSRANIYDRAGKVLADQGGRVVAISAVKKDILDWTACLNLLAPATSKDPAVLQRIYDESSPDWLMNLGTIEPTIYDQQFPLLELTCAAKFSSRPVREYPNGTIAANIIGTVGYPEQAQISDLESNGFNADSIIGKSGLERSWDERLRGQPGGQLTIVSQGSEVLREIAHSPSRPSESIWLTIDSNLQAEVQQIIASYYDNAKDGWAANSKGAAAVIMDVHTGAILAMVSYPTYDANAFAPFPILGGEAAAKLIVELEADPRRPVLNRATQGVYPLGSVMKTVSTIAVADTGVYALDQKFTCSGIWTRDITRYDWLPGGHGTITLPQALTRSCNPYFYEVGFQLNQYDPYALPTYARRMGLGAPTGLVDTAEAAGLIIDPAWKRTNTGIEWTFSDAVNMSIGQGEVQVTPLQVARLFAGVANGGILYRPQLVEKAGILGEAPSYTMTPEAMSNFGVKPEVLATVREGLCNVTTAQAGTAEYQFRYDAELQNIGVCGKTGTAQDGPRPTHAWFAAYAPRETPEIAIVVIAENGGEGSGVAAPMVRDILHYYFLEWQR